MKTILAPVDFSPTAAKAAEFAGNMAIFYNANLWFYHSYELPVSVPGNPFPRDSNQLQIETEKKMEIFKKEVQSRLKFTIAIQTKTQPNLLHYGLETFCNRIKPDIVLMGLCDKKNMSELIAGNNTVKTVHSLKYPVLVIPPNASFNPIRKIGFACDYKKTLQSTFADILEKIVSGLNAELYVLDVRTPNKQYASQEILQGMFANNLLKKINPEYHTIESVNVNEGINWFTNKAKLDWIVAIPKKYNLVDKIFNRSHTEDLLYNTCVPVLCMH